MGMGGFKGNEFAYTSDAFNSSPNQNNARGISKRILRKESAAVMLGGPKVIWWIFLFP